MIEFPKIQLLFTKFKKQFLNFQLQSVEYSDTCKYLEILKLVTRIILCLG